MVGFRQMLIERQTLVNSLVCVGLDPLSGKLPDCIKKEDWRHAKWENWEKITRWMTDIVDATAPYTVMYKPQIAHYEAFLEGRKIL